MSTAPPEPSEEGERREDAPPGGPPPPGAPPPPAQGPYAPPAFGAPSPGPAPGYPPDPAKVRNTAMLAHLSALVMVLGLPSIVGPLLVWLTQRDVDPYIDDQAKEAVNFNISVLIYLVVLFAISFITFGLGLILTLPAMFAVGVAWIVLVIVASMAASRGEPYRYPLTIRLVA